jgi:two-component system, OmpR family, sensor kinase
MRPLRPPFWRVRARLQRRIFWGFGAVIALTLLITGAVTALMGGPTWRQEANRLQRFAARRFTQIWERPAERNAFAEALADDLDTEVTVLDRERQALVTYGEPCRGKRFETPVQRRGETLGYVSVCARRPAGEGPSGPWRFLLPLLAAGATIWAASGVIARHLARPLSELVRVARDLGAGRFSSRVRLSPGEEGETAVLGQIFNDMAGRIERQLEDQRALLAAVSHEIRTPLARIRILTEMARDGDPSPLDTIDHEVVEIDELVGELLASSRLDFGAIEPVRLDALDVATKALERAELGPEVLAAEGEGPFSFSGDATLALRAVLNLVVNARAHAGGVESLRVLRRGAHVVFVAEDRGPGFAPGDEGRVFEPFYKGPAGRQAGARSVGLGLALVKRIAEAHGGHASAENRPDGGARVTLAFAVEPRRTEAQSEGAWPAEPPWRGRCRHGLPTAEVGFTDEQPGRCRRCRHGAPAEVGFADGPRGR